MGFPRTVRTFTVGSTTNRSQPLVARRSVARGPLPVLLTAALAISAVTAAAASEPHELLLQRAQALVTVKFVLVIEMEGASNREIEGETSCLVIAEDGLAVCSNAELGGFASLVGRLMGRGGALTAQPTKLEVEVDEGDNLSAKVVTRDSDRDLVWLQIELGERELPFIGLDSGVELAVGEAFYTVRRLGAFFGRAPLIGEGKVGAVVERPRRLRVPAVPLNVGYGVPVFDAAGDLAGITVLQLPGADEDTAGLIDGYPSFLTGSTKLQDMASGLILSAAELQRATRLARELQKAEAEAE